MNKAELIAHIADNAEIAKTQANAALDAFIEAVTKALKKGDKVKIITGADKGKTGTVLSVLRKKDNRR